MIKTIKSKVPPGQPLYTDTRCPKDACFADQINSTQYKCRHCGHIFTKSQELEPLPALNNPTSSAINPDLAERARAMSPEEKQKMLEHPVCSE